VIELICQFANYTDEFVWWPRHAGASPFIDRERIGDWSNSCSPRVCVKSHGVRRTCVHACIIVCVRIRACVRHIRNHVARCTDSTSSIGAPNAEVNEEEEEEDRIDSPVTQTRDRATSSLTSLCLKQESHRPPRDAAREK